MANTNKDKRDYLNIIDKNVRDEAQHFVKSGIVSAKLLSSGNTIFTLDTIKGFAADDPVFIYDSSHLLFTNALAVDLINKKITLTGDLTAYSLGSVIKKNDAEQYLDNAILTYSKFKPLLEGQEYLAISSQTLDLPTNWEQGFSQIEEIKYGSEQDILDDSDYKIIMDSAGNYKIYTNFVLTSPCLITFSVTHYFDDLDEYKSSLPDFDRFAVCDIASAYYLLSLASRYAQSVNSSIGAEVVNNDPKPAQYTMLYNMFMNKAAMWLNLDVDELKKGIAQDDGVSSNQEIPRQFYDDDVLIRTDNLNF